MMTHRNRLPPEFNKLPRQPLVSILVPAWNEKLLIKKCIGNLVESTYTNYEIIILAGGSDGTFEVAANLSLSNQKIKAFEEKQRGGKMGALNKGLKLAKGEIIILVDADTLVEKKWLEYLITPIVEGRASATSGNPYPYKDNWMTCYHFMCSSFRIFRGKKSLFGAATVAVKKEVFEKIGGYDESAYADDYYLDRTVKALGYNIENVERAKVKTDFSSTFIDWLKIETRWTRIYLHDNLNKISILEQILDPMKFIITYFKFFNSLFFLIGFSLFFLSNISILIVIKTIYIFIYSTEFLNQFSKPFLLFLYSQNKAWLKYFYSPIIFLIASYFYTIYGMLTYYKSSKFYKGSRKIIS